jgi:hypothetical protein
LASSVIVADVLDIACPVVGTAGDVAASDSVDNAVVMLEALESVVDSAGAFVGGALGLTVSLVVLPGVDGCQPSHRESWICWINELTSAQFVML